MKFILKLIQVSIVIVIILLTGYLIDEKDRFFTKDNNASLAGENQTDIHEEKEISETDEIDSSSTNITEPASEHITPVYSENALNINEESESASFNYDMEAIDKHSIGHLKEIQDIIEDFKLSPHDDKSDLYGKLYSRNFMHLENELEEKNLSLYTHLSSLIESINEHPNFSDSTSIITILDEINTIVDNIISIE